MAQIGFESQIKRMQISRCHTYMEKGKEGLKEVEKCVQEFVEKEYKIPTVQGGNEDFIELNIPQPQRDCRVFKIDIPEVICRVRSKLSIFLLELLDVNITRIQPLQSVQKWHS